MGIQEIICIFGVSLNFAFLIKAQILPEPLVPYNNRNSVCYGPGTHGQFRPFCPDNDTIIAVQQLRVGSKPVEADCPSSVTELTDHTGSYLVDHSDITRILNESACCFPDESQDCTFVYNYTNSGLEYKYHIDSSGYSESKPDMEVSWEKTRCNSTSIYPSGTHFMYMDYSCIKRTKIGDMCSNSTYTTTDGTFYLYNSGYPSSVKATVDFCQCDIQSDAASIQFYTIDLRLKKDGNECKQSLNITDSEGTTTWDCESAPIFNLTKRIHYPVVTATFINDLQIDGGYVWIGVSGQDGDKVIIDCKYQLKQGMIQATTPVQYTSTAKEPTVTRSTVLPDESTFEIHRSTASNEIIITLHESTLSASENIFTSYGPTVSTNATTFALHESTLSESESIFTLYGPTVSKFTRTTETHESTLSKSKSTFTVYESTASAYVSTSAGIDATMYTSERTSVHESRTTSKYTTPNTQSPAHQYTIVIKDYRLTIIVIVSLICGLVVFILVWVLLKKKCVKPTSQSQVGPFETSNGNRNIRMVTKADNSRRGHSRKRTARKHQKYYISRGKNKDSKGSSTSYESIHSLPSSNTCRGKNKDSKENSTSYESIHSLPSSNTSPGTNKDIKESSTSYESIHSLPSSNTSSGKNKSSTSYDSIHSLPSSNTSRGKNKSSTSYDSIHSLPSSNTSRCKNKDSKESSTSYDSIHGLPSSNSFTGKEKDFQEKYRNESIHGLSSSNTSIDRNKDSGESFTNNESILSSPSSNTSHGRNQDSQENCTNYENTHILPGSNMPDLDPEHVSVSFTDGKLNVNEVDRDSSYPENMRVNNNKKQYTKWRPTNSEIDRSPSSSDVIHNSPLNKSFETDTHKTAQTSLQCGKSSSEELDHLNKPEILYERTESRHLQCDYSRTDSCLLGQFENEPIKYGGSKTEMKYTDTDKQTAVKDSNGPGNIPGNKPEGLKEIRKRKWKKDTLKKKKKKPKQ